MKGCDGMELNYWNIEEMLNGNVIGSCTVNDDSHALIGYAFDDEDGPVYKAMWESKRNERVVWYCVNYYHIDGTVEEMFEHEEVSE